MMKSRKTLFAAAGLGIALAFGGAYIAVAQPAQPHMQNALADLQAAQHELQVALRDKGGHREAALNLTNQAITQVQAGIAVGAGY